MYERYINCATARLFHLTQMDNGERLDQVPTTSTRAGHERSHSPSFLGNDPYFFEEGEQDVPSSQRLGNMGTGTQDTLPSRMVAKDSLPNNDLSLGGVPYTPHKYYYTLVLRNYGKVPTAISCLYVEHDQHMHVLLQAKDNISRKVDRLLNDCLVSANDWWLIKNTRQLVRNVYLIIQYFKFRGIVKEVGTELHEEWEHAQDMPPIEPQTACFSDIRRAQTKSAAAQRAESRHVRFNNLLEELKRRDIRQYEEVFSKFSVGEITELNTSMGVQWREIAKQQIQGLNAERLKEEKECTYLDNLQKLRHDCTVKHPREVDIGTNWLMMLLNQNGINIEELLRDIVMIMDKETTKVNTLCFKGQTNTGKTLLASLITSHLTVRNIDNLISY